MDKTAVVILHYKNEEDTLACIDSLFINHAKNRQISVVVVINPATDKQEISKCDQFASKLQNSYRDIHVLVNSQNLGFAGGNNIGIKQALELGSEYVVLLNNDTVISLELIPKLVSYAKTDPKIGVISPKIYFAGGFEYHQKKYNESQKGKVIWYAGGIIDWANMYASHRGVDEVDTGQYDKAIDTDFATGCCMLITRNALEKVGFFDEKYFVYFEDVDFSRRVKDANMRVVYYPGAILWHKNAASSGRSGSALHIYYQNRNRLYFGFKYASFRTKKALFFDSLRLLLRGGPCARGIWDYYTGQMGRVSL